MQDRGLGSWPTRRARMSPAKTALVDRGTRTSYGELDARAVRLAHGLRGLGVERGDRVAYLGLNSATFVETMFAVAKLGAVMVPLNTRLAAPETAFVLADSEPRMLVWDDPFEQVVTSPEVAELGLQTVQVGAALDAVRDAGSDEPLDESVSLDDLFMIQYTSGTSGRPKGVMLTHGNVTWNVYNILVDVDVTSEEVALVTAPLFHTAAPNQLLFPTILKGGTALIEARWDAERAIDLIESEGVTFLFGVTTMYYALLHSPRFASADLSTLRLALSGGAPLPEALLAAYLDRGLMIVQGYGLTESSPGATMLRPADGMRKIGSAGTSCFFTDVRVVDPVGEDVGRGGTGEVLVQGPNVTPGYWRSPDATAGALDEDGWLRTGDVARVDEEGYLYIVDRLKDMIISGGENIYPAEVEQAIYEHPGVAEVAVIGMPDERWGEVGRAVVVAKPGAALSESDILDHLDGRLARYKIPRRVDLVEELPHNASGKLVKTRLRAILEEGTSA
ncbi:long-chain fatty acid--CoA ligase [Arsenicicoccus piscis]|nr:long-chain fatty acid--CoA ligase [Arsenicicoccus piscis]MCH8627629.1 long-chain fatty acid--CoA ligase [Arsenicicoccus piscis]